MLAGEPGRDGGGGDIDAGMPQPLWDTTVLPSGKQELR
jgi:hypothetical protein